MGQSAPDPSFWQGRPVLVTGGHGFLGTAVGRMLDELGATVTATRSSETDRRDRHVTRDAVDGADTVIPLAARVGGFAFTRRNPGPPPYDNLVMGPNIF